MTQLLMGDSLRATARKFPDKTAFVFKDRRITFREFEERVNRLANGLLDKGYQPGDHIAILAFNCIELFEILYALAKAGMTAVPINFRLVGSEITYILNHSGARALIYQDAFCETIETEKGAFKGLGKDDYIIFGGEGISNDTDYEAFIAKARPTAPAVQPKESDIWYIGYTSGTTGQPKGALRSQRASILLACNLEVACESDVVLLIMPLFHSNSIWFGSMAVYYGCTTVIHPSGGFDPREVLATIERERISFSSLVPTMYNMILQLPDKDKYDTSSVRRLLVSSSPLMTETKKQILSFFSNSELFESYGATEIGLVTWLRPEDQYRTVRSCGKVAPFCQIKLIDSNGNECAPGEVGELYAISPGLFDGYYKQPDADAAAFMGRFASVGDMATVDENGFYYLVDRKKDMIISGGENIYPTEIDDVISTHPKVYLAATIGVPDEKWGEAVKSFVVLKPGETMDCSEITSFCKERLASYKCPKSVEFVDSLPMTQTGKILKRELRDKFWQGMECRI